MTMKLGCLIHVLLVLCVDAILDRMQLLARVRPQERERKPLPPQTAAFTREYVKSKM